MPQTWRAYSITAICMPRQMPRKGTPLLAGVAGRGDLALDAAAAEAARHQDAVGLAQQALEVGRLGVDPVDLELDAVVDRGVLERLGHREVGVVELDVLADQGDPHAALAGVDALARGCASR